ncbi:MAG: hypothetical protein K9L02_02405 [Acholeplasmataceae bacterium]|nr:hypothetical protein [Acholeplasmataceae bacterium]
MSLAQLKQYVSASEKDEKSSNGYRATAAFMMLENVDLMIERYSKEKQTEQGAILLDVFGLLQGFFVAIDALYDLAIGLTQYKYHINVNSNETLRELKFIRNDIVGHPTHRTYEDGGTGFSILSPENFSKDGISYKTYIYEKNKFEVITKDVKFAPLIDAYHIEKDKILSDIYAFLQREETKTNIPEKIYALFETVNDEVLEEIRQMFISEYQLEEDSNHRFLWRLKLVEVLIHWEETDPELQELILYMSKIQSAKLYAIAMDLEKRKYKELFFSIPPILTAFYKFVRKHEKIAYPILKNLNDPKHPYFQRDLIALMSMNPNKQVMKLLRLFKDTKDESKIYLIGSMMKAYRPRN